MSRLSNTLALLGEASDTALEEEALCLIEDEPPSQGLVQVLGTCASLRAHAGDPQGALPLIARIEQATGQIGLPESAVAPGLVGMALTMLGDETALQSFSRAVELAHDQGRGQFGVCHRRELRGKPHPFPRPEAGSRPASSHVELARTRRDRFAEGYCLELAFMCQVWMGEWPAALAEASELDARLQAQEDTWDLQLLRATHALLLALMGRPVEAEPLASWAEQTSRSLSSLPFLRVVSLVSLAKVRAALGRADDARDLLRECAAIRPGAKGQCDYIQRLPHAVRTALVLSVRPRAQTGRGRASRLPLRDVRAHRSRRLAGLRGAGLRSGCSLSGSVAASGWDDLGVPFEAAQCRLSLARALAGLGHVEAKGEAELARRSFTDLGARPAVCEAQDFISQLSQGVRTP